MAVVLDVVGRIDARDRGELAARAVVGRAPGRVARFPGVRPSAMPLDVEALAGR